MHNPISNKNSSYALDFLLLIENYKGAYTQVMFSEPELAQLSFEDCSKELFSRGIYYGDSYTGALASLGISSQQVIPDCEPLQRMWASENGVYLPPIWLNQFPLRKIPQWIRRQALSRQVSDKVIEAQVQKLNPRYIWCFSGYDLDRSMIQKWRQYSEKIILWWSCPLKENYPYEEFDLILSCIPSLTEHFQSLGIKSIYMPHAFDASILDVVKPREKRIPRVAFAGSLSSDHLDRVRFLDALSHEIEIDFFGTGVELLPEDSPLRANYLGPVWGKDLYSVYASYQIVLHKNINVATGSASAKRLFEATGMGSCLLADIAENSQNLFDPNNEIVVYSNVEECIKKVNYLINNPERSKAVAKSGQRKTLREHTYQARVTQLLNTLRD